MTTLTFVRHGETEHNVNLVITSGRPGLGLTANGRDQCRAAAHSLREKPTRIYSSPLRRAAESAALIAQELNCPVTTSEALVEMNVGDLEGKGDPKAFARLDSSWDAWYWRNELDYPLGPGGETALSAMSRFEEFLSSLRAAHSGEHVVAVSHGTYLQLVLSLSCANLEPRWGHRRWILNGGAVVTHQSPSGLTCVSWCGEGPEPVLSDGAR